MVVGLVCIIPVGVNEKDCLPCVDVVLIPDDPAAATVDDGGYDEDGIAGTTSLAPFAWFAAKADEGTLTFEPESVARLVCIIPVGVNEKDCLPCVDVVLIPDDPTEATVDDGGYGAVDGSYE